jgi:2-dehydro-3-deoxygalactonokinase
MDAAFVGVDWGTSNARFMLIDADGGLIEERSGPGISRLAGAAAIEAACFEALGDWPRVPVVMAGMVGSNIGWRLAPYVTAPAAAQTVAAKAICFAAGGRQFALLPGVETTRSDGLPDVMRGEETQIFGGIGGDDTLVCLPGTHSKWAVVANGAITGFHTAMTGELLEIMGRHSILLNPKRAPAARPDAAFLEGVAATGASAAGLETMLFTVRSRQIAGTLTAEAADSYLSGLCIGADIRSALALHPGVRSVTLIGSPALAALYASALTMIGIPSHQIDGRDAVLAGLTRAYREIFA